MRVLQAVPLIADGLAMGAWPICAVAVVALMSIVVAGGACLGRSKSERPKRWPDGTVPISVPHNHPNNGSHGKTPSNPTPKPGAPFHVAVHAGSHSGLPGHHGIPTRPFEEVPPPQGGGTSSTQPSQGVSTSHSSSSARPLPSPDEPLPRASGQLGRSSGAPPDVYPSLSNVPSLQGPLPVPTGLEHDIKCTGADAEAGVHFLERLCDGADGFIRSGVRIERGSIRRVGHATAAADTISAGARTTIIFFPERRRYYRQMKLQGTRSLRDVMPQCVAESDVQEFRHNRKLVLLPAYIEVELCRPAINALASCMTPQLARVEFFLMCAHVYSNLVMFHRKNIAIRDIALSNVVRTQSTFMFADYTATINFGSPAKTLLNPRQTPPELATAQLDRTEVHIEPSFDIWQIGMLLYEAHERKPYWPPGRSDSAILHILATPSAQLPHEESPVADAGVQAILTVLLTRNPRRRPNVMGLRDILVAYDSTSTVESHTIPCHPDDVDIT